MKGPDKQASLESQGLYLLELPCPQGLLESLKPYLCFDRGEKQCPRDKVSIFPH